MPLLDREIARREDSKLLLRPAPAQVRWTFGDLISSDGHTVRCAFGARVGAIDSSTDRKMLSEAFLAAKPTVTLEDVMAHFSPALRASVLQVVSTHAAAELLGEASDGEKASAGASQPFNQAILDALQQSAAKVAFSCGLELVPPFSLELESPSYMRQKIESLERTLAERRMAGQVEHFERAAGLLQQFQKLREAAPGITPSAVLGQISPSDQGAMLQALLLASAREDTALMLWAVAGNALVKIDPRVSPVGVELIPLSAALGPLRSVQPAESAGRRVLLIGARSGVMIAPLDKLDAPTLYHDPELVSQQGFSKALIWREQLWACHGDGGIVCWDISRPERPALTKRPAELHGSPPPLTRALSSSESGVMVPATSIPGARHLTALDEDRLIFASGATLLTITSNGALSKIEDSPAEILSILGDPQRIWTITRAGQACARLRTTLEPLCREERGSRLTSAAALPWLGDQRLLLATEDGPVVCLSFDDPLVTQYTSSHRGLTALCAAPDLIAGASADRQRVVLWQTWDGKKPAAEVNVTAIARHRLAGVAFG